MKAVPRQEGREVDRVDPRDVSLLRYAVLLTGDPVEAEDLLQEAWVKFLKAQRENPGREIENERAFLSKVVATTFISGRRRTLALRTRLPSLLTRASEPDVQDQAALRDQLGRALDGLPVRVRTAVVLRYYQDLDFGGVAEALGCSEGTARSLVSRGLRRLRIDIKEGE